MNAVRFGVALLVGRGLRFGTEAYLGARYGARAEAYLKENFVWASLVVVAVVVLTAMVYRRMARRPTAPSPADDHGTAPSSGA